MTTWLAEAVGAWVAGVLCLIGALALAFGTRALKHGRE
jgi:hypothetical protein